MKTVYVGYYHWYDTVCILQAFETEKQAKAWMYRQNKSHEGRNFNYQIVNFKPKKKK